MPCSIVPVVNGTSLRIGDFQGSVLRGTLHSGPYTCIIAKQRCITPAQIENKIESDDVCRHSQQLAVVSLSLSNWHFIRHDCTQFMNPVNALKCV